MILKNKKLIPFAIIGVLGAVALLIRMNPPESPQRPAFGGPSMTVETSTVMPRDYQVMLQSYGTVQPRTRSVLIAQVSGQIVEINDNVRDGGFFEKGDVLGQIDPRDYEADVQISQASLADAKQTLAEANARSEQALEDWDRLGNEGEPSDLVLRVPQLQAAEARVASAESALSKARLDLERTQIVAPYAGRVIRKLVDVGQVVSSNTQLAEIYATDVVEIRLPLRNRDLGFIDLPESYRYSESDKAGTVDALIKSDLIGEENWQASLVRTESAIDETARQLHVIAQIVDPFGPKNEGRSPLKIGQYVTAEVEGKLLPQVLIIPNNTIYQGTYVYTAEEGILRRKDIEIAWQNDQDAIVSSGLEPGSQLVTTPLGQVTSGIRVSILGEESPRGPGGRPAGQRPSGDGEGRTPPAQRSAGQ